MRRLMLLIAPLALCGGELFRDDFSKLPNRVLSEPVKQLTNAIQEYHYLPHRGVPLGVWENAIVHADCWAGGDEDGKTYVENHELYAYAKWSSPVLVTGDTEWSDYTLEAKVRPLLLKDMAGIVFRYHTNRHHYIFALEDGRRAVLRLRLPEEPKYRVAGFRELASAAFVYDTKRYYTLKVENEGARMRAYVDGKLVIEASDGELLKGRIGVTSNNPARFTDVRVSASDAVEKATRARIAARETELRKLRAGNPQPKLWKRFETPLYGAGRNARFGDLDGDGQTDMLIAQNVRKAIKNSFDHISCLTAVTLDGKVLWQIGRPEPYNDTIANDTPFQIHDIDGDGVNEVVVVKDFKIQVLEGKTGRMKQWAWMPEAPRDNKERPYELEVGDSIFFADFAGRGKAQDILIKDRYRTFWVFDNRLRLQWQAQANIGHFPYAADITGDGKDELFIGYSMFSHDGRKLWSRDAELDDHADGIIAGNFSGDAKQDVRAYIFGSDEGFLMLDREGTLLSRSRVGHTQSPAVAKFRPDMPGLQLMSVNFWKNPGIVTLFSADGRMLAQAEPIHSGSALIPVNWRGDGEEFVVLSANVAEGGMMDGHLRRVVLFPDDGHPDLTYAVMNLTGDERDEVVVWDEKRVWIYTQDRPFAGTKIYAPVKNPDYNESNYRVNYSLPGWKEVRR